MVTNQELAPKFAIKCLGGRIPIQGFLVGSGIKPSYIDITVLI